MNPGVDLNLLWAAAAGLIVGAGVVFLLLRRGGSVNRERVESLATELEETRLELEGHREEVSKHFVGTSDLFRELTEQYTRLYAHLATGAREFCPDEVPSLGQGLDNPLLVDEAPQEAERKSDAPDGAKASESNAPAEDQAELEPENLAVAANPKSNGGSHLSH